jgi:hypothetical protein
MYLLWHIVRKDLYRLRLHLALWGVTLALAPLAATVLSRVEESMLLLGAVSGVLFLVSTLLGYAFFVELVTGDPVAQANAFWVTRPISWLRLLAAKITAAVLGAAAMLALVGLLQQIVDPSGWAGWGIYGATFGILTGVSLLTAILSAALSRNLRESVLWSCLLFAGTVVALNLFPIFSLDGIGHARRTLLAWIVPLVACALIVHQFATLRRTRTLVALGAAIAGITAIAFFWPWPWPRLALPPPENAEAFAGIRFAYQNAWRYDRPGRGKSVTISVATSGVPAAHRLVHIISQHTWSWQGNVDAPVTSTWTEGVYANDFDELAREALAIPPHAKIQPTFSLTLPSLDADTWARLDTAPPAYTADLAIAIWRADIAGEVPLRAGETMKEAEAKSRILSVDMRDGALIVRMVHVAAANERSRSLIGANDTTRSPAYFLVNRRSGEHLRIFASSSSSAPFSRERHLLLSVSLQDEHTPLSPDFLRDIHLVQVAFRRVAVLRPRLKIPEFKLAGSR